MDYQILNRFYEVKLVFMNSILAFMNKIEIHFKIVPLNMPQNNYFAYLSFHFIGQS